VQLPSPAMVTMSAAGDFDPSRVAKSSRRMCEQNKNIHMRGVESICAPAVEPWSLYATGRT
jgi:hypothetical protein